MSKIYYIYIMANKCNGTLYISVTGNLEKRINEHKNNMVPGFTQKYQVHMPVHVEQTLDVNSALYKEKQLKKWNRKWKLALIEKENPNWNDLSKVWIPDQVGNDT